MKILCQIVHEKYFLGDDVIDNVTRWPQIVPLYFFTNEKNHDNWTTNKDTVKPFCNDHLYNKLCYLWFIHYCVLMKTEGTNSLLVTISASWGSSKWPLAT